MARKKRSRKSRRLHGLGAMSTGAKVGIGVGIAALLGGGIWWFMRSRKAKFTGRSVFANRGPLVDMSKTFDPATVRAITDARKSIPGLPGGAGAGGRDMF